MHSEANLQENNGRHRSLLKVSKNVHHNCNTAHAIADSRDNREVLARTDPVMEEVRLRCMATMINLVNNASVAYIVKYRNSTRNRRREGRLRRKWQMQSGQINICIKRTMKIR